MAKLITVFGARRTQGGSVFRALLQDPQYKVRAVTRDPDTPTARLMREMGPAAEVVAGHPDDPQTVREALRGAYGCFAATNFWQHKNPERDTRQGKHIAAAAKQAGVRHLVYIGHEHVSSVTGVPCPPFDAKGLVEAYIKALALPCTIVRLAFGYENFALWTKPEKIADGRFGLGIPMDDIPLDTISEAEVGACIREIFNRPSEYMNKTLGLSGDRRTIAEYAAIFTKHLSPKTFFDTKISAEDFEHTGSLGHEQGLASMFAFLKTGQAIRDINLTHKLNPNTLDFDRWVQANKQHLDMSIK